MTTSAASRSRRVRERGTAQLTVLFDANIIFDLLLWREPWCHDAVALFEAVAEKRVRGHVAVHTIATLWYVLSREIGPESARRALRQVLDSLAVAPLDGTDLRRALELPTPDFEDACQIAVAERAGAEMMVTRDARHYRGAPVAVISPAHLVAQLGGF